MQQYFGRNYHTPAHEGALWAAVPIGRECYRCHEVIDKGDDGWIRPYIDTDGWSFRPIHRECDLLDIVGHMVGICRCTMEVGDNYNSMTTREMAKECMKRWESDWSGQ